MATFAQISVVMGQLGERLECQSIVEFEKSRSWIVVVDDTTSFDLLLDEPVGLLHAISEMAPLPQPSPVAVMELMLQYNDQCRTTGGVRLGLSAERQVTLIASLPAGNIDAPALAERLLRLTEMVTAWRELIEDSAKPGPSAGGTREGDRPASDHMIRL